MVISVHRSVSSEEKIELVERPEEPPLETPAPAAAPPPDVAWLPPLPPLEDVILLDPARLEMM